MARNAFTLVAAGLLAAAAGAPSVAAGTDRGEDGNALQPSGKPISCVPLSQVRETRVVDDSNIDFFMRGRSIYRNHLPSSCPGLSREGSFIHSTPIASYCSGDLITVFQHATPGFPGATCGIGEFQPMVRAAPAAQ